MSEDEQALVDMLAREVGGSPHRVEADTVAMPDVYVTAFADAYEQILRANPQMPRPCRVWYTQLAECLRSVQHYRATQEQPQLAAELGLPRTWQDVEELNDTDDEQDQA